MLISISPRPPSSDDKGAAIEYGLIAASIAVAMLAAMRSLGNQLSAASADVAPDMKVR